MSFIIKQKQFTNTEPKSIFDDFIGVDCTYDYSFYYNYPDCFLGDLKYYVEDNENSIEIHIDNFGNALKDYDIEFNREEAIIKLKREPKKLDKKDEKFCKVNMFYNEYTINLDKYVLNVNSYELKYDKIDIDEYKCVLYFEKKEKENPKVVKIK